MKYRIAPDSVTVQEYTRIEHNVMRWRNVATFTNPLQAKKFYQKLSGSLDRMARIANPALKDLVKLTKSLC